MNHLCNSHCEFCGTDLLMDYQEAMSDFDNQHFSIFTLQLVTTTEKMPIMLDYGFQADFSCSICWMCATSLLTHEKTSYQWHKCHCCGLDTKQEDKSAFRIIEVEPTNIEYHLYERDSYEFISADVAQVKGAVGYTVCMWCALPELGQSHSGEEMMPTMIEEAIKEGDVSYTYREMLPGY